MGERKRGWRVWEEVNEKTCGRAFLSNEGRNFCQIFCPSALCLLPYLLKATVNFVHPFSI